MANPHPIANPPRKVLYRGEERELRELCKEYDIRYATVQRRLDRFNWPLEKALTEPPAKRTKRGLVPVEKRKAGIRTQIVDQLMQTFFADPHRFEDWVNEQMDNDFGQFYKTYIMPFLPKETRPSLDGQEKAKISIEFNFDTAPSKAAVIDVN
jgi:hypothetical protein